MNKQQLTKILAALVYLEHNTKNIITNDEYWNIVALCQEALCQEVEAPQFITEYFATKANSAQS